MAPSAEARRVPHVLTTGQYTFFLQQSILAHHGMPARCRDSLLRKAFGGHCRQPSTALTQRRALTSKKLTCISKTSVLAPPAEALRAQAGGPKGIRTLHLLGANEALYQMSYRPELFFCDAQSSRNLFFEQ